MMVVGMGEHGSVGVGMELDLRMETADSTLGWYLVPLSISGAA